MLMIALEGLFDGDVRVHAMSLLLREREITVVFSFHARRLFVCERAVCEWVA